MWCLAIILLFAISYTSSLYRLYDIPDWASPAVREFLYSPSQWSDAQFEHRTTNYSSNWIDFPSALYLSVLTFTRLGAVDVIPANATARLLLALEAILGYIMLAGLISIFFTKLTRRG